MNEILKIENIQELIIELRGQKAILDSDVAKLYGVETKRINEAVKNNPSELPRSKLRGIKLSKKLSSPLMGED